MNAHFVSFHNLNPQKYMIIGDCILQKYIIIGDLDGVSLHQPLIFNSGIQQKSLKEISEIPILQMGTIQRH